MTTHTRKVCQKLCINAVNEIVLLSASFNALWLLSIESDAFEREVKICLA